jgi:hypothetical protein
MRADLDPSLTSVSLMSLVLFPFISLPITTRVLGVDASEAGIEKLVAHMLRVFRQGVDAAGQGHA